MTESPKKLGSISNLKKVEKRPFKDRIWDYKDKILIGGLILAAFLIFFSVFQRLGTNPAIYKDKGAPVPARSVSGNFGKLLVESDPPGAQVQFRGESRRAPTVFMNVPEGEFIVVLSMYRRQTVEKTVKIEKNKETALKVKLESAPDK